MDSDSWIFEDIDGNIVHKIRPGVLPTSASPLKPVNNYSNYVQSQITSNTKSVQTELSICNDMQDEFLLSHPPNIKKENVEEDVKEEVESTITIMPERVYVKEEVESGEYIPDSGDGFNNNQIEFTALSTTIMIMNRRPRHYMGINNNSLHVILHLTKVTNLPEEKIMLTLRKIRLNEEFQTLADLFDIDKQIAEEYFNTTVEPLSSYLSKFTKYVTPKIKITKQLTTVGIHFQRFLNGRIEFDMSRPHIILDSKLVKNTHLIVQIVCGLRHLQQKLLKTT